jgi:hypothetical protein
MMLRAAAFACVAGLCAPAFANGVISEFPAGGLEFKEAANIAIAREDLYLSLRQIRVHYVYRSDDTKTETHTIGFPMPKVPVNGGPDFLGGSDAGMLGDMRNYMDFKVSVDGKPLEAKLHEFAWIDGKDVSAELRAAGVPLIPNFGEEGDDAFAGVDKAVLDGLVKKGYLQSYDGSDYLDPLWEYQTVFEWQQDFAPGKTEVEISYVPLNGYPSDIGGMYEGGGESDDPEAVKVNSAEYCIDDAMVKAIERRKDKENTGYEVVTQGYVTTSGNFWKGPIEEFNLTVDKHDTGEGMEDADMVAFCPLEAKKVSDTQFQWSAKNYEPERDISVVYYDFYNYED